MKFKTIIISGGSRGLGATIAGHLLDAGNAVATFARHPTAITQRHKEHYGEAYDFLACDATDIATLSTYISRVAEKHDGIHGLINNAALGQDHLLVHASPETIKGIISINIEAPILLTRLVLKRMLLQEDGGSIVNISSICGSRGYTGLTAYSASKGAMDAFTRSLAHEVSSRGILVNSIAPGFFESEMSAVLSPEQIASIKRRTPSRRMTTGKDILPILDLLLFGNMNITGQVITIDGGASS